MINLLNLLPVEPLAKDIKADIKLSRLVSLQDRQDQLVTLKIKELGAEPRELTVPLLCPIVELKEQGRLLAKGKVCNLTVYDCNSALLTLIRK